MSSARILLYIGLIVAAVVFPAVVSSLNWNAIRQLFDNSHRPLQLFGLSASAGLIIVGYVEIKDRIQGGLIEIVPVILFLTVAFSMLIQIVEYSYPSTDYELHQRAAFCLIRGENPYTAYGYTYPPLPSQIMAVVFRTAQKALNFCGLSVSDSMTAVVLFFTFQCSQYFLVMACYLLLVRMAKCLGLDGISASGLIALLFLCNNPLIRTLKCNQLNMWVLNSMLSAYLVAWNRNWFGGLMLSVGTHIKLYPVMLIAPLLFMRKFAKVCWFVFFALSIAIIQFFLQTNLADWPDYLHVLRNFPLSQAFRDNSLRSLFLNIFGFVASGLEIDSAIAAKMAMLVTTMCTVALVGWYAFRCVSREQSYNMRKLSNRDLQRTNHLEIGRKYGHFTDTVMLMLLISPMVWEHHYVFAMPIAVWAIIVEGRRKPLLVGLGVLLIFGIPTYNVFPFSYNRLAGLLLLAVSMRISPEFDVLLCADGSPRKSPRASGSGSGQ